MHTHTHTCICTAKERSNKSLSKRIDNQPSIYDIRANLPATYVAYQRQSEKNVPRTPNANDIRRNYSSQRKSRKFRERNRSRSGIINEFDIDILSRANVARTAPPPSKNKKSRSIRVNRDTNTNRNSFHKHAHTAIDDDMSAVTANLDLILVCTPNTLPTKNRVMFEDDGKESVFNFHPLSQTYHHPKSHGYEGPVDTSKVQFLNEDDSTSDSDGLNAVQWQESKSRVHTDVVIHKDIPISFFKKQKPILPQKSHSNTKNRAMTGWISNDMNAIESQNTINPNNRLLHYRQRSHSEAVDDKSAVQGRRVHYQKDLINKPKRKRGVYNDPTMHSISSGKEDDTDDEYYSSNNTSLRSHFMSADSIRTPKQRNVRNVMSASDKYKSTSNVSGRSRNQTIATPTKDTSVRFSRQHHSRKNTSIIRRNSDTNAVTPSVPIADHEIPLTFSAVMGDITFSEYADERNMVDCTSLPGTPNSEEIDYENVDEEEYSDKNTSGWYQRMKQRHAKNKVEKQKKKAKKKLAKERKREEHLRQLKIKAKNNDTNSIDSAAYGTPQLQSPSNESPQARMSGSPRKKGGFFARLTPTGKSYTYEDGYNVDHAFSFEDAHTHKKRSSETNVGKKKIKIIGVAKNNRRIRAAHMQPIFNDLFSNEPLTTSEVCFCLIFYFFLCIYFAFVFEIISSLFYACIYF